ncbi:alpha/beta fold hydrolase [Ningiella sp. W23]|uniref:alpha/beta hydrolase family protein n=1 Tax=Ningiella sp. W23 TaxID=3023715 RepID=UPI00375820DE
MKTLSIASVQLRTQDDTALRAMVYQAYRPKAQIVLAGATGVPQRFYQRYAFAANKSGFNVLTLDYRGIAQSKAGSLKGLKMDYLDWAQQDLAAAVDYAQRFNLPIYLIGHSYGGHAVGLLPNAHLIEGAYVFGTGAGNSSYMPVLERYKVAFWWRVIAPAIVKRHGFLAWSKLGMGEDLPIDVYRQWKHWCSFPHYFFDDPNMQHLHEQFAKFDKEIVAANALDDKWAQPASRDAFFKGYKNARVVPRDISPQEAGMKSIDHMGYFQKHAHSLWQDTFDWLDDKLKT